MVVACFIPQKSSRVGGLPVSASSCQEEQNRWMCGWHHIFKKGLQFHVTEITVVMEVKCADLWGVVQSLFLPLWSGKMWMTLRNKSRAPLHLPCDTIPPSPSSTCRLPLPLTSGSNPDWDYWHKCGISKSRHLTLCRLQRLPCSFPGHLDWLRRFTRSAAGIIFVCPNLWNRYPGRTWTHETWGGKAANNGTLTMTTGGEGWKVRATGSCVKGQGLQVAPSSQGWKVKCCLQLQKKRRRTGREQDWPPSRLPAETQLRLSRLCLPSGCCSRLQPLADSGGAKIREETERGSVEKH